jgi:hypothetical protein
MNEVQLVGLAASLGFFVGIGFALFLVSPFLVRGIPPFRGEE